MKIAKLLELHRQHTGEGSLAKSLGDGYLLKQNRIFRNIRKLTSAGGAVFSDAADRDYASLPFSQLERILNSKSIPYLDNTSVLSDLVLKLPDV
ncbi:MAG: hypothetical protein EOP04_16325, partial [Proteobacteria bacterium]